MGNTSDSIQSCANAHAPTQEHVSSAQKAAAFFARWIPAGSQVLQFSGLTPEALTLLVQQDVQIDIAFPQAKPWQRTTQTSAAIQPASVYDQALDSAVCLHRLCLRNAARQGKATAETVFTLKASTAQQSYDVIVHCSASLQQEKLYKTALFVEEKLAAEGLVLIASPMLASQEEQRLGVCPPVAQVALYERLGFVLVDEQHVSALSVLSVMPQQAPVPFVSDQVQAWSLLVLVKKTEKLRSRTSLRGVLENDRKTTTYKFALLRALCDINITHPSRVRFVGSVGPLAQSRTLIPMALVAECWIRYYWHILVPDGPTGTLNKADESLFEHSPSQIVANRRLAFEQPLEQLIKAYQGDFTSFEEDFYAGAFAQGKSQAQRRSLLKELFVQVVRTIKEKPVRYSGNSLAQEESDNTLFAVDLSLKGIDWSQAYTPDFFALHLGELSCPAGIWRELNHSAPMFADSIMLGWAHLAKRLSELAGKDITFASILAGLMPFKAARDTRVASEIYTKAAEQRALHCVWSNKRLSADNLAVDHMIPWSRIHCNALWNLLPAERRINSYKSDAIPAVAFLQAKRRAIFHAWDLLVAEREALFKAQAQALLGSSLPDICWQEQLFESVVEMADSVARQYDALRWSL